MPQAKRLDQHDVYRIARAFVDHIGSGKPDLPTNHPLVLESDLLDAYQLKAVQDFVAGAGYERQRQGRVLVDGPDRLAPEYAEREAEELRKRRTMFRSIVLVFAALAAAVVIFSWRGARSYGLDLAEREATQVLKEGSK